MDTEAEPQRAFLVMLVALTFVMNLIARGVPETFAVFLLPVQSGLDVSRAEITLTYSCYMLAYGLSAPFAGQLIDRLGARITYSFGLASLGLGYLIAGSAGGLWQYMLGVGLLGGLGAASLGMIVASGLLTRWFTSNIGSIMSLPYAALGAGMLSCLRSPRCCSPPTDGVPPTTSWAPVCSPSSRSRCCCRSSA